MKKKKQNSEKFPSAGKVKGEKLEVFEGVREAGRLELRGKLERKFIGQVNERLKIMIRFFGKNWVGNSRAFIAKRGRDVFNNNNIYTIII